MTILLLGANGMLGSMIYFICRREGRNVIPITREIYDVLTSDISVLNPYIRDASYVINCIGAIPQRRYSSDEYRRLNRDFPHKLAELCTHAGVPLIHISTNCVFSGAEDNVVETDAPDTTDEYGKTKAEGEPPMSMVFRCSIIGFEKNTSAGLLEWFLKNNSDVINGYTDSIWNGLTTLELTRAIFDIIDTGKYRNGIYHHYSETSISKYELLCITKALWGKNIVINPVSNGMKYYTLSSIYTPPRESLQKQLESLHAIENEYRTFYIQ